MIITCPCAKKKFKIDANLIPATGRELKCGSCGHVWFYINESKDEISNKIEIPKKLETQNIKVEDKNLNLSPELEDALNKKKEEIIDEPIKSKEVIIENKNQEKKINPSKEFIPIEDETIEKELKKEQKVKKKEQKRKKKDKPIKLLNMIIVIIISIAALIIFIDTFRIELSKYMPFLNPMLDSFYAIIADINSFIKDLIR